MDIYPFVRFLVRVTLGLYFRKIKVEGLENVPNKGPLLIIPNHQNALLDPLLVGAFIPRSVYYLTRSDVFVGRIRRFLEAIHMLPVYRIRDGYSTLSQNNEIFNRCNRLFAAGESVLIFPEGNHGEHHFLRPLTKGAARLAFQAMENPKNQELQILPVGINFFDHQAPRSVVLIKFGKPIQASDFKREYQEHSSAALRSLRDAMSKAMKETLIIPEPVADYENLKASIFNEENESLSFEELLRIDSKAVGMEGKSPRRFWAKVLNPVPFLILRRILKRTDDVVFHATIKYGFCVGVFPIWWLTVFLILLFTTNLYIAGLTALMMIFALFYSYQR